MRSLSEFLATRESQILHGGSVSMPDFTDLAKVAQLSSGLAEAKVLELVGEPDRRVPLAHGERWLWEMDVYLDHIVLVVDVVEGRQQGGPRYVEIHTPDWLDSEGLLRAGMEAEELFDWLGTPQWWRYEGGRTTVGWEITFNLVRDAHGHLCHSDTPRRHSLTLEMVDGRLVAPALPVQHDAPGRHD